MTPKRPEVTALVHTLTLSDRDCPFDTVCFHAQQCAEKALKGFLAWHEVPFEKIHDLSELLRLCAVAPDLVRELDQIEPLIPYAVEARYPGEWDVIDRAEAERRRGVGPCGLPGSPAPAGATPRLARCRLVKPRRRPLKYPPPPAPQN